MRLALLSYQTHKRAPGRVTVTAIVQCNIRYPEDSECNAYRDNPFHLKIRRPYFQSYFVVWVSLITETIVTVNHTFGLRDGFVVATTNHLLGSCEIAVFAQWRVPLRADAPDVAGAAPHLAPGESGDDDELYPHMYGSRLNLN